PAPARAGHERDFAVEVVHGSSQAQRPMVCFERRPSKERKMSAQRQAVPAVLIGEIEALYRRLLETWNQRNAREFAALFEEDANLIGFDGSPIDGRADIERHIGEVSAPIR